MYNNNKYDDAYQLGEGIEDVISLLYDEFIDGLNEVKYYASRLEKKLERITSLLEENFSEEGYEQLSKGNKAVIEEISWLADKASTKSF